MTRNKLVNDYIEAYRQPLIYPTCCLQQGMHINTLHTCTHITYLTYSSHVCTTHSHVNLGTIQVFNLADKVVKNKQLKCVY